VVGLFEITSRSKPSLNVNEDLYLIGERAKRVRQYSRFEYQFKISDIYMDVRET